jgi:multiple sugar transport system substrate-binding protein
MCIAVLLTALGACGPALPAVPEEATEPAENPTAEAGDETASAILGFAVSNMDRGRYDNLIDAFEADNPGVHISTVSIEGTLGVGRGMGNSEWPEDAYLLLAANADVIAAPATREAVQQGALLDLTHLFESDSNLASDAFYPGLLESVQWDGGIWSLPVEATYPLIYFDKEKFDAAGLDYPQPGWTWDDFLTTAQALTIGDGDAVSQWGFVELFFDPVTFVQSKAGLLFDPATGPPAAKLDSAAVVDAVRWYTDLFLTHKVAPFASSGDTEGPGGFFSNQSMQAINNGQAAMWYGMGGFGPLQRGGGQQRGGGSQNQTTGAVPFPVGSPSDHTTPVDVDGLSISAGTQKADLAWQWISFLVQQQGGRRGDFRVLNSGAVPAIPSVAASSGFWDNLDEEYAAALQYAIDHAYVDTYDGAGYDTFSNAVVSVMEEGKAVEAALADAQAQVEAEIEAEVAAAPTPVAGLVVSEELEEAVEAGAVIISYGMAGGGGGGGAGRFGQQSQANLVEQFQEAHRGIIVELETPRGFRGQLDLAAMAAEYDCFQSSPSFSEDSLAAIMNLEPFLAADAGTRKEDFYPSVLEQFTYQGQVWGLPGSVTVNTMNYNKDLFDAAGIDYPSVDWTTGEFLEMAVALTQGDASLESKKYGYVPSSSGVNDLLTMMDRLGVEMLDDSVDPPRLMFNSSEVIDAVRWYASLSTEHQVTPVIDQESGDPGGGFRERQTLINEGRAAMWTDGGGGGPGGGGFRGMGTTDLNTGVVPLPAGPNSAQGSGFQSVSGFFISSQTGARQACWEWITFLTEQPSAVGLPARRAVAESAEYRQEAGAERADAYIASVSGGSQASFFQRLADEANWLMFASNWLSDAYDRILDGEMTVEESLAVLQEMVDAFRNCVITNEAFQDPGALRECATEVGGSVLGSP